jgi:hypothetical protein
MKQIKDGDTPTDGSLSKWKIVCAELDVTLEGDDLIELRQEAIRQVDRHGDPKIDYRFVKFENGIDVGPFVVTSSEGLRHFRRLRLRHAS